MTTTEEPTVASTTEDLDRIISRLRTLPKEEQRRVVRQMPEEFRAALYAHVKARLSPEAQLQVDRAAKRKDENYAPVDDDDLWQWVREEVGIKIPRKAVCPGHSAPFTAFSDAYFERYRNMMWVGNRGSGKTKLAGVLHAVNGRTKPGWSGATIGARKDQAFKCYGYFSQIVQKENWRKFLSRGKAFMTGTPFKNGCNVEVLTGTIEGVNSPHPVLAHWDEVELLRDGVFQEGLNMAQSQEVTMPDGTVVVLHAMNLLTSSWKKARGFVSDVMKQVKDAELSNDLLPYKVHIWCLWETTKRCEHDCNACPFSTVRKGWINPDEPDESKRIPRTFEWACKRDSQWVDEDGNVEGKLKHTDGFVQVEDSVQRFATLSRRMFESQQESRRPTLEGIAYDWDETKYDVTGWEFDPANGPITVSIDPGGTVPSSAGFWQRLKVDVAAPVPGRVPAGALVRFDEIYVTGVGATELGVLINRRIGEYEAEYDSFEVEYFCMDAAARMASLDLAKLPNVALDLGVPGHPDYRAIFTQRKKGYKVEESIQWVKDDVVQPQTAGVTTLLYVDVSKCEDFCEEIGTYELDENGKPLPDQQDHAMDEFRYRVATEHVGLRIERSDSGGAVAVAPRPRAVRGEPGNRWNDLETDAAPAPYGASPIAIMPNARKGRIR